MKGKINKEHGKWVVEFSDPNQHLEPLHKLFLHPIDVEYIDGLSKIFDNVDSRILSDKNVEFEVCWWSNDSEVSQYAKLTKKNNKIKSCVDWLEERYSECPENYFNSDEFNSARELHRQEMKNLWMYVVEHDNLNSEEFNHYYTLRYGK